jgi:glycosyltransferase involved in cell wall biosynthesis
MVLKMATKLSVLMIGPHPQNIGGIASYIKDLTQILETKYDIKIYPINPYIVESNKQKERILKIYLTLFNVFQIMKFIIKNEFDIVHIHTSSKISFLENSIYIVLLKITCKKSIILHIHAPDFDTFLQKVNKLHKFYIRRILKLCDTIIVLSDYWKIVVNSEINDPNKLIVIPNAANPKFFISESKECSRERIGLPKGVKIVFSLGNLIERKGFHYLIDAIADMIKKREDFLCFIGGTGPLKDRLERQINKLDLQNYIKLINFIPDELVPIWMNAADIFVLPSLNEGLPIVQIEAMSCGLPVVATAVSGNIDLISSGENGVLIPPKSPKEMADAISILLDDDKMRGKLGKNARETIEEKFTWDIISNKILECYELLVGV